VDLLSGAVKVTPAHDYIDFEVGKRHNLEMISIISEKGEMNEKCGRFSVSITTFHLVDKLQGRCELVIAGGDFFVK
jgi:valyl-tRNA synthetase